MPASEAASRTVAFSSALICFASMIRVLAAIAGTTETVKTQDSNHRCQRLFPILVYIRSEHVCFQPIRVFLSEKPQSAQNGIGCGLAETTEAGVSHHIAKLFEFFQVAPGGGE